jgi:hypothetical protein
VTHKLEQSAPFLTIGGLASAAFLYGYSAIVLPSILNSVLLPLLWLALFAVATRWFTRRPRASLVLPVLAIVAWFTVLAGQRPS